jgi:hypothetical protein
MVLFLGPIFYFVYMACVYVLCAPFYLVYAIVKGFLTSTSRAQLPTDAARQFAKRGMVSEAARWYVRVRQDDNYGSIVSFGLFGPRRNEILNFYVEHRDKLGPELRDVLGNTLWTDAVLSDKAAGWLVSDNRPLIELAAKLVDAAHRPKEAGLIEKLRQYADETTLAAPGFAGALRQDLAHDQLGHRHRLEPVTSGIDPERPPAKAVRIEHGRCCLCGTVCDCKGLDVYARVSFHYSRSYGTGTFDWNYARLVAWLKVLFCERCVPRSAAEEWHNIRRRQTFRRGVGLSLAAMVLSVCLWYGGVPLVVLLFVLALCAAIAWTILIGTSMAKFSPEKHEYEFYRMRVAKFLHDERERLVAACDLTGCELKGIEGVADVTPSAKHVTFDIEPGQFKAVTRRSGGGCKLIKGSNGIEWIQYW